MKSPLASPAKITMASTIAFIAVVLAFGIVRLFAFSISTSTLITVLIPLFFIALVLTLLIGGLKQFRGFTKYRIHFAADATDDQVNELYREIAMPPPGYRVFRSHRKTVADGHKAIYIEIFNIESKLAKEHRLAGYRQRPGVAKIEKF